MGERSLPEGTNLRLYSRLKADRKKSSRKVHYHRRSRERYHRSQSNPVSKKRPLALWEEILERQGRDLFKNIGRKFSLSEKKTWKKYEAIKNGISCGEPPLIVFKCSQKGAVFHGLVAYKIEEYESRAVIWVYDCNLIYTCNKSNIPSTWTKNDKLKYLSPLGLEDASREELADFLTTSKGKQWRLFSVSDPSSTQIIFDKTTGRFSFCQKYMGLLNGLLMESYIKEPGDSENLKIKVEN